MNLSKYEYHANEEYISFTFSSIGPRGIIKKVVTYEPMNTFINGIPIINLAFGDWNEQLQKVDDSIVSNNDDRDKVLATVASTVLLYLEKHGQKFIFAVGITPVKTRLYQMGINAHLVEIEALFIIKGLFKGVWLPFESGRNFDAFLILKKES
jgi:hypothetical protein